MPSAVCTVERLGMGVFSSMYCREVGYGCLQQYVLSRGWVWVPSAVCTVERLGMGVFSSMYWREVRYGCLQQYVLSRAVCTVGSLTIGYLQQYVLYSGWVWVPSAICTVERLGMGAFSSMYCREVGYGCILQYVL